MISLLLRARDMSYMAVYTVHEPPVPAADRIDRAESLEFIREGFSWGAALVPPVWLISQGAWMAASLYLAAAVALCWGLTSLGAHPDWIALSLLAFNVLVGFEAPALQRWALELEGWTELGSVSGRTREDCERRFFDLWLQGKPVIGLSPGGDDLQAAPGKVSWLRRLTTRRHS